MQRISDPCFSGRRGSVRCALLLLALIVLIFAAMCIGAGVDPCAYPYPS